MRTMWAAVATAVGSGSCSACAPVGARPELLYPDPNDALSLLCERRRNDGPTTRAELCGENSVCAVPDRALAIFFPFAFNASATSKPGGTSENWYAQGSNESAMEALQRALPVRDPTTQCVPRNTLAHERLEFVDALRLNSTFGEHVEKVLALPESVDVGGGGNRSSSGYAVVLQGFVSFAFDAAAIAALPAEQAAPSMGAARFSLSSDDAARLVLSRQEEDGGGSPALNSERRVLRRLQGSDNTSSGTCAVSRAPRYTEVLRIDVPPPAAGSSAARWSGAPLSAGPQAASAHSASSTRAILRMVSVGSYWYWQADSSTARATPRVRVRPVTAARAPRGR